MKKTILIIPIILVFLIAGCIERQAENSSDPMNQEIVSTDKTSNIPPLNSGTEVPINENTDTEDSSNIPISLPLPISDYNWDDWEFDDISALSSGFAVGDNPDGYNVPTRSVIYRLPGEFVKVFGPDNTLILSFNDSDIKVTTIVPGGMGQPPASGLMSVPNGGAVDKSKYIMLIKLSPWSDDIILQSVNLRKSCDNITVNTYDSSFLGAWSGIAGDIDIDNLTSVEAEDKENVLEKLDEINAKLNALKEAVEVNDVVVKTWFEAEE